MLAGRPPARAPVPAVSRVPRGRAPAVRPLRPVALNHQASLARRRAAHRADPLSRRRAHPPHKVPLSRAVLPARSRAAHRDHRVLRRQASRVAPIPGNRVPAVRPARAPRLHRRTARQRRRNPARRRVLPQNRPASRMARPLPPKHRPPRVRPVVRRVHRRLEAHPPAPRLRIAPAHPIQTSRARPGPARRLLRHRRPAMKIRRRGPALVPPPAINHPGPVSNRAARVNPPRRLRVIRALPARQLVTIPARRAENRRLPALRIRTVRSPTIRRAPRRTRGRAPAPAAGRVG